MIRLSLNKEMASESAKRNNRRFFFGFYVSFQTFCDTIEEKKVVTIMKKILPILGVVAGAAAFVAYKMKKEEQKQIIDLDQGLLEDEDETLEEGPISDPASCCESVMDKAEEVKENVEEKAKNLAERTEELMEDVTDNMEEHVEDASQAFKIHIEDAADVVEAKVEDAKAVFEEVKDDVEEAKDERYPHLNGSQLEEIRGHADAVVEELEKDGDVHNHERPVQHRINFTNMEDMDNFKNTVINKGFVITNGDEEFQLMVLHITAINKEKLYDNMFYLADTAAMYHGVYLGWTSKVVY